MPQNKVTSETRRNILKVTSKKKKQDDKQRKITRKENTKTQYNIIVLAKATAESK